MIEIENPILPGFNPDPSICRVGSDYFIATSTFEWYPGVQIHHSRDLKHWRLASRPLNRPELLNMLGNPDSCGVWAPCLSWHEGLFYLVYTDVKRFDGAFKDTHNHLTWCAAVDGDWAPPVYLNSSGFDPSLFHDDDGRKWYANMVWDHRPNRNAFRGIALQEYDAAGQCLVGEPKLIFEGTKLGCTEAPHIYKRAGRYYLMMAEGGTGYCHAVSMARADAITGPYEPDPAGSLLTSAHDARLPLQRAGHGDLVETPSGNLYLVHLCSRPLPGQPKRSPLGRETALQRLVFTEDGWFRLAQRGKAPAVKVRVDLPEAPWKASATPIRDDFDSDALGDQFQWLRTPWPEEWMSLTERLGHLRLHGMESIGSWHRQALIARRQEHLAYEACTQVDFAPGDFQEMAGLVCYYNTSKFHYLYLSYDDQAGRHLNIMSCLADRDWRLTFPIQAQRVSLPNDAPVELRVVVDGAELQFHFREAADWTPIGPPLDASVLSDETGKGEGAQFTGAFVGVCCQDLTGRRKPADFDYFEYRPRT